VWGTGTPRREFLHVDDCADALVFLLRTYSGDTHVNVGSGEDLTINELTAKVCEVVGFRGQLVHDLGKPDGTPRKLMSADRLRAMGWQPRIGLAEGLASTYAWFLANEAESVGRVA
jgi:GDP-L-fucose synthase